MDAIVASPEKQAAMARHQSLTMAALGIVFGDIGTSPLYTMHQTFGVSGGLALNTLTVSLSEFATRRSRMPSPFTSPAFTDRGCFPTP